MYRKSKSKVKLFVEALKENNPEKASDILKTTDKILSQKSSKEFTLHHIPYQGRIVDITLEKELTAPKSLNDHLTTYPYSSWRLPSSELYFAMMKKLAKRVDSSEERKLRDVLLHDLRNNVIITGTTLIYSKGINKDSLIHDAKTNHEKVVSGLFLSGEHGDLQELRHHTAYARALFDATSDTAYSVIQEFAKRPIYLLRLKDRPHYTLETAVSFNINSSVFDVFCYSFVNSPSRRVIVKTVE